MADCSKAIEFSRELYRLCNLEGSGYCSDACPFRNASKHTCPFDREITQEDVDIVQKWSDEHPVPKPKTYADDFFEKFPNAAKVNGRPAFCRGKLYGAKCISYPVNEILSPSCLVCWNMVME